MYVAIIFDEADLQRLLGIIAITGKPAHQYVERLQLIRISHLNIINVRYAL